MSIIVAVSSNDRTVIASDSLTSFGDSHRLPPGNAMSEKIRPLGDAYMGGAGWGVYDQILDAHLEDLDKAPDLGSELDIFLFFNGLWRAMHEKYPFVNDQAQSKDSPFGDLDSSFLIVNDTGIYKISSDMAVTRFEQYYAIGSGTEYASALHVLYEPDADAEAIARHAVKTAIAFDAYCGGEVLVCEVGAEDD